MARCCVCGNDYDNAFKVQIEGDAYVFDTFKCAIHALAPACPHCDTRIIGHGVEANGAIFCCTQCAEADAQPDMRAGDYMTRPALPGL
jgi:hypothetical protein